MHIDFTKPTILTLTQYGTKVTIELDHSDTSIDELFDAFTTTLIGQGYMKSTIDNWIIDKADEINEDRNETEKIDFDWNTDESVDWNTINISNGLATDEDIDECENNELSEEELRKKGYKGVYKEYPMHDCWCGNEGQCDCISEPNDNDEYNDYGQLIPKDRPHFEWGDEPEDEEEELDNWFNGEEFKPNDKLKQAAQRYSDEVRAKHTPIKEQKVLGKWQLDNKNKKIVHTVRKGKIKDLKK